MTVAHVFVDVPMWLVRPRLQHNVKPRPTTAAILSRKRIGNGLELSNRVWGRINDNTLCRARQVEVAVQVPGIRPALPTVYRNIRALQVCGIGECPELAIETE